MKSSRLLFATLAAGTVLRLVSLDVQPLWWDEGYSVYFSTEPLSRLIELTSFDIHPPLYYVLLKAWFAVVGISPVRARLLSVLLGLLALRAMWGLAHRLAPRPVAVLATALLAISPFHIYYSQEVRMYALLLLLTLGSVVAFLQAVTTGTRRWKLMLFVLLVAVLLTQYYGAFVVLALGVAWWWLRRESPSALPRLPRSRQAARWLAVVAALYLPWVVYAGPRLYTYVVGKVAVEADQPLTPWTFAVRHAVVFSVGHLMPSQAPLAPWAALFVGLALLGAWHGWRRARWQTSLLLAWLLVPFVGTFLVNLVAPFTDPRIERQLIIALPPFLLLVAWGLDAVRQATLANVLPLWFGLRQRVALGLALVLMLINVQSLFGFYTIPRYPNDDYRPLLAYVAARQGPNDAWLAVYPWQIGYLRAYLPHRRPQEVPVPLEWSDDPEARRTGVRALYARYARLWFPAFQVKGRILEERLAATLREEGVPVWDEWYGNTRLWLTARADTDTSYPTPVSFGGGGTLTRVAYRAGAVPSGVGVVPVVLSWEGPTDNRRVSLQLIGPGETVWGEFDGPLTTPETRAGVLVEPGTPPLRYALRITIYDAETGRPFDVLGPDGNPVAPSLKVSDIVVSRPPAPIPVAALPFRTPIGLTFGETVRLVGASLITDTVKTGDVLPVTLFWQALNDVGRDYGVFVQAIDEAEGRVRGNRSVKPVENAFPTHAWRAGDLVRDPHPLLIEATASPGRYRVIAGLYDLATGERLRTRRGADHAVIGTITVEERPHLLEPPPVAEPIELPFGEVALLVGATVDWPQEPGRLRPGDALPVTLVWQPQTTPAGPVRSFVQLLDEQNKLVANSDHPAGEEPATAWIPGEYIVDRHQIFVPADVIGRYRLIVGLYDARTGQRFLTPEGDDFLELSSVEVTE